MQPSLIMYDDDKESFWAAGVDRKGASDAMVSFTVGVFVQSGYVSEKVSLKSDQERSTVALINTQLQHLGLAKTFRLNRRFELLSQTVKWRTL